MSIAVPIILLENCLCLDFIASILINQLLWNPVYTLLCPNERMYWGLFSLELGCWFVGFFLTFSFK